MLELTDVQIGSWVASFVLPMFRVAALLTAMPLFGSTMIPRRIRLYFSFAITVVIAPALPPMPPVNALDLHALLLCAEQIVIGALMGLSIHMLFQVFVIAGQMIATQMGMSFASMIDPVNGVNVATLSQFFNLLVALLFLSMNGHLVVFEVLVESFNTLPVGDGLMTGQFWDLANRLSWVLGAAVLLVLPAITSLLVVNIALGVMTRAAPQLNIFSVGMPITIVAGMVILWISMADLLNQYQVLATDALQWLRDLIRAR
ncbi:MULTISPECIES: flagellar biosynthetic protein FliR [unclassified Pseudomonas]|uniref:flagellar biosynthetic protein FliR n=1 Tax=unclassified Pseudomonas TaxID=196821 RepID=UPI000BCA5597|nr:MULTISPECIES: flagellar biosynthetic protein FliR [unclassified Pseudomonas]PVZ20493.1 flagellar biosynthetic protein FliR [Pseudomonas sp. URIL14HWK12:I12]PVZ27559.1 flagellar biosynthetic protein FliR [Pseudomonas sp. URIL14HWK12:I10]PVZ38448.1 flagellar biosynthetic protein FliR [Pseudomonas sp. URIL14HWK12:I11]SNZ03312.1 flagellar biosynthetic protein FliR [Pseudomonas sp. URIL14HWK12:I9]